MILIDILVDRSWHIICLSLAGQYFLDMTYNPVSVYFISVGIFWRFTTHGKFFVQSADNIG